MLKTIDIENWERKQLFNHFANFKDPYFAVTIPFDVNKTYQFSKDNNLSFFGVYLHACMIAINSVENLKYRILEDKVVSYDVINASPTISRENKTFGFSFVNYDKNLDVFLNNLHLEKQRINNTDQLYPPKNGLDCIHCSALPWVDFSGHKEPVSGLKDSVPKLAFGKAVKKNNQLKMNVAISVNHALADGYHIGLFSEIFQKHLNK
ncbi:CatA-like O-acetyltransferase [Mesoflavibacter zeaxanthinifaciens]|uniref:CatA-like O-acetyltransferase n=1 Tax=Mesoflavibacter zeaxanthinifaciens TaxID=393060 RepID=UPI003A9140FD